MNIWSAQQHYSVPHGLTPEGWQVSLDAQALRVTFAERQPMLSSAVVNGGWQEVEGWINVRVPPQCLIGTLNTNTPNKTTLNTTNYTRIFAPHLPHSDNTHPRYAGMMTAATMQSCHIATETLADTYGLTVQLCVLLTCGMGNLRCAGDTAEYRELQALPEKVGTINMLLACSHVLTPAAMAEALMMATEAKAAALNRLALRSPISGYIATGTGTDAIAITCPAVEHATTHPAAAPAIEFVGKHTLMGETLARLVIGALHAATGQETTTAGNASNNNGFANQCEQDPC